MNGLSLLGYVFMVVLIVGYYVGAKRGVWR